ncbi:MAG TPA: 6-phosphogluconolactonase [Vicinamibacteria bacterium]|jgi:6-phosphogluconolactonase
MKLDILPDVKAVAERGAQVIAAEARRVVSERERFTLALSGGSTPWLMMQALAEQDIPWDRVHVLQVDERVVPEGHTDRNLTHLVEKLLSRSRLPDDHLHAMPVGEENLDEAAGAYARILEKLAGSPPAIDLVHLGLGLDGHTASLVPRDPVLRVRDAYVSVTESYLGRRRMTLTYPALNRARRVLWLVTGKSKAQMARRLCDGDESIPAGRVARDQAFLIADRAAAAELGRSRHAEPAP